MHAGCTETLGFQLQALLSGLDSLKSELFCVLDFPELFTHLNSTKYF